MNILESKELSRQIKEFSLELGFDLCGITKAEKLDEQKTRLKKWLNSGFHGEMAYMERNLDLRIDPGLIVEGAKSIICVALNYYNKIPESDNRIHFSKYSYGKDYHKVLKDKLYLLYNFIDSHCNDLEGRVFVDSAPVMERAWAQRSNLGWVGRNSMLINPKLGSCFFLGVLIVNKELSYDDPFPKDYCGSCKLCVDSCPTSAIKSDRSLDARKCISYQNIERKGEFPPDANISLNGWVFGCDICQDVCPWNNKAEITSEESFKPLKEIVEYSLEDWKRITEEEFNSIFRNSPVLRTGYSGFKRNLEAL